MTTSSQAKWIRLSSPPKQGYDVFQMNDIEFLMIDDVPTAYSTVYKYNTTNNTWCQCFVFGKDLQLDECGVYFDKQSQYLYCAAGRDCQILYEIDIHKNTSNILSHNITNSMYPSVIEIDNRVHIIGGDNPKNKHLIYDKNTKKITDISSYNFHWCEGLIHMKSRNSILMIGYQHESETFAEMYEFSLINNQWSKWDTNVKLPKHYVSSTVKSRNEQYVVILDYLAMYVLNMKSCKLKKSELKYPCDEICRVAIINMNSKIKDEMLVFGYVKQCFNLPEFDNVQHLPSYLVQFINSWVSFEMIHFMLSKGKHWKINIDHILCSLT